MTKIKDIKTALELFEEASNRQAEATEQGDYKTGNKYYGKIAKAIAFLKSKNATDNLLNLLSNSSVGVRMWAAYHLLMTNEKESVEALEKIIKNKDIHSLTAETTLNEWRKGNLKF